MSYEFLEELSTADVAFVARGADLPELFREAAEAVLRSMVENPQAIEVRERRETDLRASAPDRLLVDFLQEIVFYKDAQMLLLRPDKVEVSGSGENWRVHAELAGEEIDLEKHDFIVDVKAVTYHEYYLREIPGGWETQVILDV
jgi:SHS2 domain-containing protein